MTKLSNLFVQNKKQHFLFRLQQRLVEQVQKELGGLTYGIHAARIMMHSTFQNPRGLSRAHRQKGNVFGQH